MTDDTSIPKFHDPSFEAKFRGQTIGYFATADEAQAALDAAQDRADEDNNGATAMTQFYITHEDEYGELHQLSGAWTADTGAKAIARMLAESRDEDDGKWAAHVVTNDRDVIA